MSGHIDTHHHFLPKVYIDAIGVEKLASVMPDHQAPKWTAESALAIMDRTGIAEAILSISSGPVVPDSAKLMRQCNDAAADLRARFPGRFGSFASLPLPAIDASLAEIAYSLDTLAADGLIIMTNYQGRYLGDPLFEPVMEELDRRHCVVFIHPTRPPYTLAGLPPESVLEFTFDTTRAVASLLMTGALQRWPRIRFILSHAGGTVPFLAQRIAGGIRMNPAIADRVGDVDEALRAFWYDTALSVSKPQLAALTAVADPGRILFGSDYPFAPDFAVEGTAKALAQAPLPDVLRADIFRGNAARLLERASGMGEEACA